MYFTGLNLYRKQAIHVRINSLKPLIAKEVLKQTCNDQATIQKEMFSYILKPTCSKPLLRYPSISLHKTAEVQSNVDSSDGGMMEIKEPSQTGNITTSDMRDSSSQYLTDIPHETDLHQHIPLPECQTHTVIAKESLPIPHEIVTEINVHPLEKYLLNIPSIPHKVFVPPNNITYDKPSEPHKCFIPPNDITYDKPSTTVNLTDFQLSDIPNPRPVKKKKIKKRKISDCEAAIDLKTKLYNMFRNNPSNLQEPNKTNETHSPVAQDTELDSLSSSNTSFEVPLDKSTDIGDDDLVPIRRKLESDDASHGSFSELIFVNECYANIGDSSRAWLFNNTQSGCVNRTCQYEKMWCLDRLIFRKVKHLSGFSVYMG